MPTVKELRDHLNSYKDDDIIAFNLWSITDVMESAKNLNIEISEEEAEEILETTNEYKNTSIGINWDVIEMNIFRYDSERERQHILNTPPENRPLLIGTIIYEGNQNLLNEKLKETS